MPTDPIHTALLDLSARAGGPLLGIDTSGRLTSLCSVGFESGEVTEQHLPAAVMPSEALADALGKRMQVSGVRVESIKGIVIGVGPGSFTGLRVGLIVNFGSRGKLEIERMVL